MIFELEPVLNKQYLLSKHSQETYIEHYLGIPIKKGLFKSPLRNDNNPTCSFYTNKSGDLIFKDFSGEFSGNFINVVMHKYNCSYYKALKIIAKDFGLISGITTSVKIKESKIKFNPPKSCIIQVTTKDFSKSEFDGIRQCLAYDIQDFERQIEKNGLSRDFMDFEDLLFNIY